MQPISVRFLPAGGLFALVSRSHPDPATEAFLARLSLLDRRSMGSSLKFCRIAEGSADLSYAWTRRTNGIRPLAMRSCRQREGRSPTEAAPGCGTARQNQASVTKALWLLVASGYPGTTMPF